MRDNQRLDIDLVQKSKVKSRSSQQKMSSLSRISYALHTISSVIFDAVMSAKHTVISINF